MCAARNPHKFELLCVKDLVQDGVMVLVVCILVEVQLNDVPQQQRFPGDRMPLELLDIWHNVGDVIHCAVGCASLHVEHGSHESSGLLYW